MVSRRTNFGERSEPAPDRGGKLQSAGGGGRHKVTFRHCLGCERDLCFHLLGLDPSQRICQGAITLSTYPSGIWK